MEAVGGLLTLLGLVVMGVAIWGLVEGGVGWARLTGRATPRPDALAWLRLLVALADDVGLRMGNSSFATFAASTVAEIAYESGLPGWTRLSLENAPQEVRSGV